MKGVHAMSARDLRRHLADDHGKVTSGWQWREMVAEHDRHHRVALTQPHEHDVVERPE